MKRQFLTIGIGASLLLTAGCESMKNVDFSKLAAGLTGPKAPLAAATVDSGLREALIVGTRSATAQLSRDGGYSANPAYRWLVPEPLQAAAKALRGVGMGSLVDTFEQRMNQAAEKAAAQAAPVFMDAVGQMTFADAKNILTGGNTAATDYFREKTTAKLLDLYRPIAKEQMAKVGAVQACNDLIQRYNQIPFVPKPKLALEDYVSQKGIDGLFAALGEEEKKIRLDPQARTTDLLRQVFGTLATPKQEPAGK